MPNYIFWIIAVGGTILLALWSFFENRKQNRGHRKIVHRIKQTLISDLSENHRILFEKFEKIDHLNKQKEEARKAGDWETVQACFTELDILMKEIENNDVESNNNFEERTQTLNVLEGGIGKPNHQDSEF